MFFIILGTYTRWTFVIFSLVQRILLLIFPCHTVTHGTDLRRSPHMENSQQQKKHYYRKQYMLKRSDTYHG